MITLKELFDTYMRLHGKPHCRSWRNLERCFDRYLSHWADRPADSIKKIEVQELHAELGQAGKATTANRVVQLLRPVYNMGLEWEIYEGRNPAKGVKMFRLQPRERFMEKDEVERFLKALSTLRYQTTRDCLLICLLTAARRDNVRTMRWEDISLARAVWHIPRTKNGLAQNVPLVPLAIEILKRRKANSTSEWVFPSKRSSTGHLTRVDNAWSKIIERSGMENLRVHDLRRTLASWQAMTGSDICIIAKTLNHKDLKSTAIYARLNVDPVRVSMERAVEEMGADDFPDNAA